MLLKKVYNRVYHKIGRYLINHYPDLMPDKWYLSVRWKHLFGYFMDWKNPKTLNEKFQWLKVYDRNPRYTLMVNKHAVKQEVENLLGEGHTIKTLGVYESSKDIDYDALPEKFVLKCTHDSGSTVICKDRSNFDKGRASKFLDNCLKTNFYLWAREWPYKNVPHKIIAEEYIETSGELNDYKFWCFNGVPTIMYITVKGEKIYENFYDMDFSPVYIDHGHPRRSPEFDKPETFDEMLYISHVLSSEIPFVRVDMYEVNGIVKFSEMTFYDWGGFGEFGGVWDLKLGNLLILPSR